jgi:hypothetical protein
MRRTVGFWFCLLVVRCFVFVRSTTITGTVDTAGTIGESATFQCNVTYTAPDGSIYWSYYPASAGGSVEQIYFSGYPEKIAPGFSVSSVGTGHYDLTIDSITFEHGVRYECRTDVYSIKGTAELIALDAMYCPPSGQEILEGTDVLIGCGVKYTGAIPPTLTWTDDNALNMTSEIEHGDRVVNATMNVTLGPEHDDVVLTCLLEFNSTYPTYTNNCTTLYYVLYNVTNMETEPKGDANGYLGNLPVDSNIRCIASGRPAPDFRWVETANPSNIVSDTENMTITDDMVSDGAVNYYTCIANNTVEGVPSEQFLNISFIASANGDTVVQSGVVTWVIVVAVVVPVVVIAAAAIGGYFLYKHHKDKKAKKKKSTTPTTTTATAQSASSQPLLYTPSSNPPPQTSVPLNTTASRYYAPMSNVNYGVNQNGAGLPPPRLGGAISPNTSDRNSAGFADLGALGAPVIPMVSTHPGSNHGSSTRLYAAPAVSMRPNPVTYPYQPSQSVHGAGSAPPGSSSSTGSRTPSYYGPPVGRQPSPGPAAGPGLSYAPSVDASHHSSLV